MVNGNKGYKVALFAGTAKKSRLKIRFCGFKIPR
jgi:hypothetical protein